MVAVRSNEFSPGERGAAGLPTAREDFIAEHLEGARHRPIPVAALRRSGPSPLRVLLCGGGPLVGWGLRDHAEGLAGRVADALAAKPRRGIELDVVADPAPARAGSVYGLSGMRLGRFDAIVLLLGDRGRGVDVPASDRWPAELVQMMVANGAPTASLSVWDSSLTVRPDASRAGRVREEERALQARSAAAAAAASGRVVYRQLPAPDQYATDERPFTDEAFTRWGTRIADHVIGHLPANHVPVAERSDVIGEALRQKALAGLGMDRETLGRLMTMVVGAKQTYGVHGAALCVVDETRVWSMVATPEPFDVARRDAYCSITIEGSDTTIVNDTLLNPRTAGMRGTLKTPPVRFYAGHPIRTWDGYRIGCLTLTDLAPRALRNDDLTALRRIATQIEQEIWSAALRVSR